MARRDGSRPAPAGDAPLVLRLYVAGHSSNGARALRNLTRFCEAHVHGRYALRVIDILKEPEAAAADGVIATPTVVRGSPGRVSRMFGNLDDEAALAQLTALGTSAAPREPDGRPPRAAHGNDDEGHQHVTAAD